MRRSDSRILTTHTGSLPRPAPLTELYAKRAAGESIDANTLETLAREATRASVANQLAAGIDVGNNGEQSREGFFLYVQHRMSGFGGHWTRVERQDVSRYPGFAEQMKRLAGAKTAVSNFTPPKAIGEIRYLEPGFVHDECRLFRETLDAAQGAFTEAFVTAPSPGIIAKAMKNEHYDTEDRYLDALATALQIEYEAIVEHGFLLQLDCPDLALERHITYQDAPLAEFLGFVERVIGAINRALVNIPRDRVRMHVCWGNYEGPHDCDVPLEHILPPLLEAKVGALVLPFANPRHAHEVRHLKHTPLADDQVLVAGVIDTLTNFVEHPETIADRLELAARAVGDPTRVMGGTDCGFDTSAGMGRVAEDVVWAKLASLTEGARIASERLF